MDVELRYDFATYKAIEGNPSGETQIVEAYKKQKELGN
jgi:hypothetical protein